MCSQSLSQGVIWWSLTLKKVVTRSLRVVTGFLTRLLGHTHLAIAYFLKFQMFVFRAFFEVRPNSVRSQMGLSDAKWDFSTTQVVYIFPACLKKSHLTSERVAYFRAIQSYAPAEQH